MTRRDDDEMRRTVVGRILLSRNHRLRVEQGPVRTRPDIVNSARLKIDVERTGNVFARASLGEERREATVAVGLRALSRSAIRLYTPGRKHVNVWMRRSYGEIAYVQPVLERVKLPCSQSEPNRSIYNAKGLQHAFPI